MSVSPEHQIYIQTQVNPLLEALVTAILLEKPQDPVPFMVEWLEKQNGTAATKESMKAEIAACKSEIATLEAKLSAQRGDDAPEAKADAGGAADAPTEEPKAAGAADASGAGEGSDAESEDNDDDVDENWEPPAAALAKAGKMRGSVSAEAYGEWNKKVEYVPVVVPKSEEQKEHLKAVLGKSWMFANLDGKEFNIVVDAMEEMKLEPKQRIITKGDDGDCMYVVDTGKLECKIMINDEEKVVKVCEEGDAFGELALLYNCPRAAHVDGGDTESVIWRLSRECFNGVVKEAAAKKRERNESTIGKVEILQQMDTYEKGQLADALRSETAAAGSAIITQGDVGDKFYIIEDGAAIAEKDGEKVMDYGPGDYFGELALMNNAPRAATVKAGGGEVRLLTIDRRTFKKLLGPLDNMMKRASVKYE